MPSKKKPATKAPAKKKPTRRKSAPKKAKSFGFGDSCFSNIWSPLGSSVYGYGSDLYGSQPNPSVVDLIEAYEDVVFGCVAFISNQVGKHIAKTRLCVATGASDNRPKSATKQLDYATNKSIQQRYGKFTRRAVDIQEIVDHPVLDLLDRPNATHSFSNLMALADVYLELTGSAFIYKARNQFGIVRELWLLESQYVTLEVNDAGIIEAYVYKRADEEHRYSPSDIVHIQFADPLNPYGGLGRSPLRAVWQRSQLLRQEQSSWQAILTNMSFPSALIFPPAEADGTGTFTPDQATRLSRQISERFRFGNQGGPWVLQDRIDYQPISTPPKDQSALTMYGQIKQTICAAYGVPVSLIDGSYSSGDADTAKRAFQETSLQPRLDLLLDALTHQLVRQEAETVAEMLREPLSSSRRLFLCVEDVVQPDRNFELQKQASTGTLFAGNLITQNEGRAELGLPPIEGGNRFIHEINGPGELLGVPSLPGSLFERSYAPKTKGLYRSTLPDAKPLAEALRQFFAKQGETALASLKTATATTKAFVPSSDWAEEMKRMLTPILRAYLDEGANAVFAEIGADTAIPTLPVQELDKALSRSVLALAESTHATTELEVDKAVRQLREQLRGGLAEGEANRQLRERVQGIFSNLSETRAYLIAETESTRAKHAGELIAIQSSGVEAKKKWLPDSMACDLCKELAAMGGVNLEAAFKVVGTGPYARIEHPPAHPSCRCTLAYELEA